MKNIAVISLLNLLTALLLIVETKFLILKKYESAFFDFFSPGLIIPLSLLAISLTTISLLRILKSKYWLYGSILSVTICLILFATLIIEKLDTAGYEQFRKDLGISAYTLYLDPASNEYLLRFSYPFGQTVYFGRYTRQNQRINLDQTVYFSKSEGAAGHSIFDLRDMGHIK